MDTISHSGLEVKVRSLDAKTVMAGLQKIANRITTGTVLASLIMGASTLMQTETRFRIFGYPDLAILCFLGAATGGFWLVISIFMQDRESRKKATRS
jgi:ubiquinone biosynthesis protein